MLAAEVEREHQHESAHHATLRDLAPARRPSRSSSRPISAIARVEQLADDRLDESNCSRPTDAAAESRATCRRRASPRTPRPMSWSSGRFGRNRAIASRPTGMSSSGRMIASSALEPRGARVLLLARRHAIAAAARARPGIASRDRGDVDATRARSLRRRRRARASETASSPRDPRTVVRPPLPPCPAPARRASRADARRCDTIGATPAGCPHSRHADERAAVRCESRRARSRHALARSRAHDNRRAHRALPSGHRAIAASDRASRRERRERVASR